MDDNVAEVEPLLRQCEALGITYLVTLYSHSRGAKPGRVSANGGLSRELLALKKRHRHFVALRGYLERFSEAVNRGGIDSCQAGRCLCNIDSQGDVTRCIDRLDEPAGNLLRDEIGVVLARLAQQQRTRQCHDCWTSCRGSIETLMSGPHRWLNLRDYWQMTRPVPLGGRF
jgi:hypothetical protein